jgi:hypothetical protein
MQKEIEACVIFNREREKEDLRCRALVWTNYRPYKLRSKRSSSAMQAFWYLRTRSTGFQLGHAIIATSSALLNPSNGHFHGSTKSKSVQRGPKGPEGKDCTGTTTRASHLPMPLRLTLETAHSSRSGLEDPLVRLEAGWVGWRRAARVTPRRRPVSTSQRTVTVQR